MSMAYLSCVTHTVELNMAAIKAMALWNQWAVSTDTTKHCSYTDCIKNTDTLQQTMTMLRINALSRPVHTKKDNYNCNGKKCLL